MSARVDSSAFPIDLRDCPERCPFGLVTSFDELLFRAWMFESGHIRYVSTDVVADGQIESSDINITGNNAANFVYTHRPM